MSDSSTDLQLLAAIEHTLLRADATAAMVDALCDEARAHGFFGVCVNPIHVARCRARLARSGAKVVSVIGFPLGASFAEVNALEAERAVAAGADELDAVIALGAAKAGSWSEVELHARAVVAAAQGRPVKLILETGVLDADEIARACEVAVGAGVAFVKTCSGFAPGHATIEAVELMARAVAGRAAIKASGGIRSAATARALLAAGASRIGTSSGVAIAAELGSTSTSSPVLG